MIVHQNIIFYENLSKFAKKVVKESHFSHILSCGKHTGTKFLLLYILKRSKKMNEKTNCFKRREFLLFTLL